MKHIKPLLIGFPLILLASCANLQFDPVEYNNAITLKELNGDVHQKCGTSDVLPAILDLKKAIDRQEVYTEHRSGREHITQATINVQEIVNGLYVAYQRNPAHSTQFCVDKTDLINNGLGLIINQLGEL